MRVLVAVELSALVEQSQSLALASSRMASRLRWTALNASSAEVVWAEIDSSHAARAAVDVLFHLAETSSAVELSTYTMTSPDTTYIVEPFEPSDRLAAFEAPANGVIIAAPQSTLAAI